MSSSRPPTEQPADYVGPLPREQLVYKALTERPIDVINRVHESGESQYKALKKRTQNELSFRVSDAHKTRDRKMVKIAKKKVDNQASTVAGRERRKFIVNSFETVIKDHMERSRRLAEMYTKFDAENRDLCARLESCKTHIDDLQRRNLEMRMDPGNQWLGGDEAIPEVVPGSHTLPVETNEAVADNVIGLSTFDDTNGSGALSNILESNMAQDKLDGTTWNFGGMFSTHRISLAREQMRGDNRDDIFHAGA